MGKTRVYELAQKLGMENKTLLEKLKKAGIDAKSHMSVLEPEDVEKIDVSPEEEPSEANYDEKRITPGVIRRRRKETSPVTADVLPPRREQARRLSQAPGTPVEIPTEPSEATETPQVEEETPVASAAETVETEKSAAEEAISTSTETLQETEILDSETTADRHKRDRWQESFCGQKNLQIRGNLRPKSWVMLILA